MRKKERKPKIFALRPGLVDRKREANAGVFSEKPWSQFVQVKKSALARWAAVPAKEKAIVRASLDAGSDKFTRRFQEKLDDGSIQFTGRFGEVTFPESGLISPQEMSLIHAYRRGGHDGVRLWLKSNAAQTRRAAQANSIDHLLLTGWYADDGFSLCWLTGPALFEALVIWGLEDYDCTAAELDKGVNRIRKRVKSLKLERLVRPIADRMNIDSAVVGKRPVLVVS